MKPIKGMNLDVSADAQPKDTYRIVQNWIYDKQFDALVQEPGTALSETMQGRHIVGAYGFEDGDIVLLTTKGDDDGGSSIFLYNHETEAVSLVIDNNALGFNRQRVYDIAAYRNAANERIIVYCDGETPPRMFNIDIAAATQPPIQLSKIWPDIGQVNIARGGSLGGILPQGNHFFAIRYLLPDRTVTSFTHLHGPFAIYEEQGGGFVLDVTGIDTAYESYQIGVVSAFNSQFEARVVYEGEASASTAEVLVDGTVTVEELTLESILVAPVSYTKAGTVAFHDNRLHFGAVGKDDETSLQTYANKIEPHWVLRNNGSLTATTSSNQKPKDLGYQPDEVYAFYIAWIKEDGSYSQAYHIPGRKAPDTMSIKVDYNATTNADTGTGTETIDPLDTILNILQDTNTGGANDKGQLSYLRNDIEIYDGPGEFDAQAEYRYFHTRCTATAFGEQTVGPYDLSHGRMGIWYNYGEVYPSDFPDGTDYSWTIAGNVATSSTYPLAGQPIRHHRIPSLAWAKENGAADIRVQTFDVRFHFIEIPTGYTSAVIYAAKRTQQNNIVFGTTPLHFGQLNSYALKGNGGYNEYRYYSSPSALNTRQNNAKLSTSNSNLGGATDYTTLEELAEVAGIPSSEYNVNDLYTGDGTSNEDFTTELQTRIGVHFNKGLLPSPEFLVLRPTLPSRMHIKPEYCAVMEEVSPGAYENDYMYMSNSSSRSITMEIRDPDSDDGYENTETEANRNRMMNFKVVDHYIWAPPQAQVCSAQNARYIPAGGVDDDVRFDNRMGPETCYFEFMQISDSTSGYAKQGYVYGGQKMMYTWLALNNTPGSGEEYSGTYSNTSFGVTSDNRIFHGYNLDTNSVLNVTFAVARIPIVNVCAARITAYSQYALQDLVTISRVVNSTTAIESPELNGATSASRLTMDWTNVWGDTSSGLSLYRMSRPEGWNNGLTNSSDGDYYFYQPSGAPFESAEWSTITVNQGSIGYDRGSLRAKFRLPVTSVVDIKGLYSIGDAQRKLGDYERLVEPVTANNTNSLEVLNEFQQLNMFRQPSVSSISSSTIYDYPFRIIRSNKQQVDREDQHLRVFAPLNYFEQTRDRGRIVNLHSYQDKLLIHHERGLFLTIGQEKLSTSSGDIVVGDGDIFRVNPTELVPSEYGYAGTQHLLSCTMTPQGYFFVDESQKRVFMYNGQNVEEISNRGMRTWFQEHLTLRRDFDPTGNIIACHSFYPGIAAEYDPEFNRVVLMIRNNKDNPDNTDAYTHPVNTTQYYGATAYTDISKYVSFSLHNGSWIALHTYDSDFLVGSTKKLFSIVNNSDATIYRHGEKDADVGSYLGKERKGSFIDVAFPAGETMHWQAFKWLTKSIQISSTSDNTGHIALDKTFEKAMVYNDYQCSGEQGFYKAANSANNAQRTTLRQVGVDWQWNGFRDLVADRTRRFLDPDYVLDITNIDSTKEWYDQRRFLSSHAVVRLITSTSESNPLYLYNVDAKARKAYR